MPSVNQRGFAWLDETKEHSEQEYARAQALANKWSQLHHDMEQHSFRRQADLDDGYDYGYEPEPCETCGGDCYLGLNGPRTPRGHLVGVELGCGTYAAADAFPCPLNLVGIKCPNPYCEDGDDMQAIREAEQAQRVAEAERQLEIELVQEKMALIGARMMRSYEHWNEDEHLMAHLEDEYSC